MKLNLIEVHIMIDFICEFKEESWNVTLESMHITTDTYEMIVSGHGSRFHIIVGSYAHGSFLCIPALGVGCELSYLTDVFWNRESIGRHLSAYDTETIVCALKYAFALK